MNECGDTLTLEDGDKRVTLTCGRARLHNGKHYAAVYELDTEVAVSWER